MASDIFNVQPPAWLVALDKPLDAMMTGQAVGALAGGLINAATRNQPVGESVSDAFKTLHDPMWQTHKAEADLKLQLGKVALDTAKRGYEWAGQDAEVIPKWLQMTPQERAQSPLPEVKTPQAQQFVSGVVRSDAMAARNSGTNQAIKSWSDRVTALSKIDPEAAGPFLPSVGTVPSPTLLQAFSVAQLVADQKKKNEAYVAETEAMAQGLKPTTTISDKGVTKTYHQPGAHQVETAYPHPTIQLHNGVPFLYYRNFAPHRIDNTTADTIKKLQSKLVDAEIKVNAASKNPDDKYTAALATNNFNAIKEQLDKLIAPATLGPTATPNPIPITPEPFQYKITKRE